MEEVRNNSNSISKNSDIHPQYKLSGFQHLLPTKNIMSFRDSKNKVQSTPGRHKMLQNKIRSK